MTACVQALPEDWQGEHVIEHFPHYQPNLNRPTVETTGRHSRLVSALKITLGVLAAAMLALLISFPMLHSGKDGFRISFSGEKRIQEPQPPRMNNPRFQGTDGKGQPFTIAADYAMQESPKELMLHKMEGDIMLQSGSWVAIRAEKALLNIDDGKTALHNNVELFHDAGYNLRTESVQIDLKQGLARSQTELVMQGPLGTVYATGFIMGEKGDSLTLLGPVQLVIYPPKEE